MNYYDDQDSDTEYMEAMQKNFQMYPEWKEKFSTWTWQKIMQKLRSIGVSTSRAEFEEIAENCQSAYQVSNILLDRTPVGVGIMHNLGILWAASEALWEQFLPDFLNLEMLLKQVYAIASDFYKNKDITRMDELVDLYVLFLEDFIGKKAPLTFHNIQPWNLLNKKWLHKLSAVMESAQIMYAEKNGKIHLEASRLAQKFETAIPDIHKYCPQFLSWKIWTNFVDGNEDKLDKSIDYYELHFEPDAEFYQRLADLYQEPPSYTRTPASELKYLEYNQKMLDFK
jgi:hypothetical protein